jgi:FkbH-like protein
MSSPPAIAARRTSGKPHSTKCVVWDLDGTIWEGTLLEDGDVQLKPEVVRVVEELSERGVLHSIASRNDYGLAMGRLRAARIEDHFIFPQIGWNPKSLSIAAVARQINIGTDSLMFVDDQEFELDEVAYAHPDVLCLSVHEMLATALVRPELKPRFVTDESRRRRHLYRTDAERGEAQAVYEGTAEEFLATLDMVFRIEQATEKHLQRAEELTLRTNQLNSTGRTYSYDELNRLRVDPDHLVLVAALEDRYGPYGTIGLALVDRTSDVWALRLLLMSCRVMARGVGMVLLGHIMRLARDAGSRLTADLVETGRNRIMQVTYRFAGFEEVGRVNGGIVLEADLTHIPPVPEHLIIEFG